MNLLLVWRIYLILFNIKPRVTVDSVIKKSFVLINLSNDRTWGWNHCLFGGGNMVKNKLSA